MKEKDRSKDCCLGLDLSTQSLKAIVVDLKSAEVQRFSINFDDTFPSYGTRDGVLPHADPDIAHADPKMWAEALDAMLALLKKKALTRTIAAIGVSAQQHGTVYLNEHAALRLSRLKPELPLATQIDGIFTRPTAPIWMDVSTTQECGEISDALGGDERLVSLTGSVATERFMGPQVRKFWKENPDAYVRTAHIALISSFITALLIGRPAPVDSGDGFGTNLANIRTGKWNPKALAATAPKLRAKLPPILCGDQAVGHVSGYVASKYGFNPDTQVIVGSGDNPNSLVGLGLIGDDQTKAISLGTSDTYFGYLPHRPSAKRSEGHIFGSADGKYMVLICHKNGSLARERIKDRFGISWKDFSDILLNTRAGNRGRIMLPHFFSEITPRVLKAQVRRFGGLNNDDMTANVRGVAEGQIMSMFLHSKWAGKRPDRILVTAGGSRNRGLLYLIAQVFNARVRTFELEDSAALGAAIRAAHATFRHERKAPNWDDLSTMFRGKQTAECFKPVREEVRLYHGANGLLDVYEACEKFVLRKGAKPEEKIKRFRKLYG